jgi:hypothetical protein
MDVAGAGGTWSRVTTLCIPCVSCHVIVVRSGAILFVSQFLGRNIYEGSFVCKAASREGKFPSISVYRALSAGDDSDRKK